MIHVLGLRKSASSPQKHFEIIVPTIKDLFDNVESLIEKIPVNERYNVYYTLFNAKEDLASCRHFVSQDFIPIDIDYVADEHIEQIVDLVAAFFKTTRDSFITVASGHGVQFLIKTPYTIEDQDFFSKYRNFYKEMADLLQKQISSAGLTGKVDTAVFSLSRLMRLPFTENRKEKMPPVTARLINRTFREINFDITIFKPSEESYSSIRNRTNVDSVGVLTCPFIKWAGDNQSKLTEPQWHAMIGVLAWIPENGRDLCHSYSEQHPNYSAQQTDNYIDRALRLTGPRTCASISQICDICPSCPIIAEQLVTTPLVIKSKDYIQTRDTGFYFVESSEKGDKLTPDYEGLVRHFKNEFNYIVHPSSKIVYIYKPNDFIAFDQKFRGNMWHPLDDIHIHRFALDNFRPFAKDFIRKEFVALALLKNHVSNDFFACKEGLINFSNGVLNARTGELLPHSMDYGFTYKLDFNYNKDAICPRFDQFLTEVVDPFDAQILLEFMAIIAANEPSSKYEKALALVGDGSNGKSVFMRILEYLVGSDNTSAVKMKDLANPEARNLLMNKLVNIVGEESEKSMLNNSDLFKSLVAGEPLSTKILYKGTFKYASNAKHIFSFNNLPVTNDTSRGYYRRFIMIEFPNSFEGREDRGLSIKLKDEAEGIWVKIVEAYNRLKNNRDRFTESSTMRNTLLEYENSTDSVNEFFEENITIDNFAKLRKTKWVKTKELYSVYAMEMKNSNRHPVSIQKFINKLKSKIGKDNVARKSFENGSKITVAYGVSILTQGDF